MIKVVTACISIGVLLMLHAMTMDVTVPTEAGGYVNNIGLLAERQNYYIVASFLLLTGFVVLALTKTNQEPLDKNTFTCPFCQEHIKVGAIICKHCKSDLATIKNAEYLDEESLSKLIDNINKKP